MNHVPTNFSVNSLLGFVAFLCLAAACLAFPSTLVASLWVAAVSGLVFTGICFSVAVRSESRVFWLVFTLVLLVQFFTSDPFSFSKDRPSNTPLTERILDEMFKAVISEGPVTTMDYNPFGGSTPLIFSGGQADTGNERRKPFLLIGQMIVRIVIAVFFGALAYRIRSASTKDQNGTE